MIKSLELKGYESHQDSKLEFHNKLNLIIGTSNTGKSSIVKSIRWLVDNLPNGEGMINHQLKSCSVIGKFNENDSIEKVKSSKENKYVVNKKTLDAIRQSVPDEVKEVTKFTDLNIQGQFDNFFLLQEYPGEVARKLNEIIELQIMDEAIKKVKSKVSKRSQDIKYMQKEIEDITKDIEKFNWVENANESLKEIEELNQKKDKIQKEYSELQQMEIELLNIDFQLEKFRNLGLKKEQTSQLSSLFEDTKEKDFSYRDLLLYNNDLIFHDKELEKYRDIKEKAKRVEELRINYKEFADKSLSCHVLYDSNSQLIEQEKELEKYKKLKDKKKLFNSIKLLNEKYRENTKLCDYLYSLCKYDYDISSFDESIKNNKRDMKEYIKEVDPCSICKMRSR